MTESLSGAAQRHPWMLLVLMSVALAELGWLAWRRGSGYNWRDSGTSLAIAIGNTLIRPLNLLLLAPLFAWVYAHRLFTVDLHGPLALLAVIVGVDFIYYWFHRSSHAVRLMWATHGVHHSSTELNLSAAYRLGWTELLSGSWLFLLVPVWLGVSPLLVTGAFAINLTFQFILHSRLIGRLGPLEWLFNTPTHHRVHHAMNETLLDRNFGGILIVWDRLFGTFAAAPLDEGLRFGIVGRAPRYNPFAVVFGEWRALLADLRAAHGMRQRLRVLAGAE